VVSVRAGVDPLVPPRDEGPFGDYTGYYTLQTCLLCWNRLKFSTFLPITLIWTQRCLEKPGTKAWEDERKVARHIPGA